MAEHRCLVQLVAGKSQTAENVPKASSGAKAGKRGSDTAILVFSVYELCITLCLHQLSKGSLRNSKVGPRGDLTAN